MGITALNIFWFYFMKEIENLLNVLIHNLMQTLEGVCKNSFETQQPRFS